MALTIGSRVTDRLAHQLAATTGETPSDAVLLALHERLLAQTGGAQVCRSPTTAPPTRSPTRTPPPHTSGTRRHRTSIAARTSGPATKTSTREGRSLLCRAVEARWSLAMAWKTASEIRRSSTRNASMRRLPGALRRASSSRVRGGSVPE
ncbi:type II toxin-antitoxin system VapB family antitoxin [Nocardia macrotermitis]|uniref:type II toxin-antitoxin system VapB family antitoxin n=1 Tax=Nocardia macrotermitis TaxID=2585198 RepID=UPI003872FAD6